MQQHSIRGRHRPGPGRLSPGELGATGLRSGRVAVRPRVLRQRVAAAAAGIILAGAGVGWVVDAHADTGTGTEFDWDSYISVITGTADSGVSTATSWMDLLLPPQMAGGGRR